MKTLKFKTEEETANEIIKLLDEKKEFKIVSGKEIILKVGKTEINKEITYTYNRLKRAFKKRVKLKPVLTINRKVYKVDIGIKSRRMAINIKAPPGKQMIADFQTINYMIINVDVVDREKITELIHKINTCHYEKKKKQKTDTHRKGKGDKNSHELKFSS